MSVVPLLSSLFAPALAAHLELTPLELCKAVEHVVVAEVTDVDPAFATDGTIERHVHATVLQTVKGASTDGVDFVLPGGTLADLTYLVSDEGLADAR